MRYTEVVDRLFPDGMISFGDIGDRWRSGLLKHWHLSVTASRKWKTIPILLVNYLEIPRSDGRPQSVRKQN